MFLEVELKLSISSDPAHIRLFLNHPFLRNIHPVSEDLISRYFDTSDLSLWQRGLSLRIRRTAAGATIQTLKTAGEQIGPRHHRHEWDQPIAQSSIPCIDAFEDEDIAEQLKNIVRTQPLQELFHTQFKRTQWNIYFRPPITSHVEFHALTRDSSQLGDSDTAIELVLDQGHIRTAERTAPLHEIELELKHGDAEQLDKLAELLKQTIPLTLENRSKAERGYLLYSEEAHKSQCQVPIIP